MLRFFTILFFAINIGAANSQVAPQPITRISKKVPVIRSRDCCIRCSCYQHIHRSLLADIDSAICLKTKMQIENLSCFSNGKALRDFIKSSKTDSNDYCVIKYLKLTSSFDLGSLFNQECPKFYFAEARYKNYFICDTTMQNALICLLDIYFFYLKQDCDLYRLNMVALNVKLKKNGLVIGNINEVLDDLSERSYYLNKKQLASYFNKKYGFYQKILHSD
jgi:hypothetical protein